VLAGFREPVAIHGHELYPTASIGVARIPRDGDSPPAVLKAADMAMYAAKRDGHNTFRIFQGAMAERAEARLRVSSELHRAVRRGEIELAYQPQLALPRGAVISLEALVRWQHPVRGTLLPAQFIGVAEESGLIVELGEWVLRTACTQLAAWQQRGLAIPRVAVNVSIHQLRHGSFPGAVRTALRDSALPAAALELELTESALMDRDEAAAIVAELKAVGVSVAIDDFGTGYSSLGRLRRLPIDLLKIDRTFVAEADRDRSQAALVRSIISLAHSLGVKALAEGVERPGQRDLLIAHGCDYASGWLWTPALPSERLEAWLADRQARGSY
jgi:EAL domain-containing protein (putative c-di-GMP-specific phosphodiesterase class I)